jgi:hypothetical protein
MTIFYDQCLDISAPAERGIAGRSRPIEARFEHVDDTPECMLEFVFVSEKQLDSLQGRFESSVTDRLEQIVDGARVEGSGGVVVVGRHEYDRGQVRASDAFDDLKAVEPRHSNVQEHEVGFNACNDVQGLETVSRFANDFKLRLVLKAMADPFACQLAVVDDDSADHNATGQAHQQPRLSTVLRETASTSLQSAIGGMALSVVGMFVAFGGWLPPVGGAVFQEIIDLCAVLNALRAAVPGGD